MSAVLRETSGAPCRMNKPSSSLIAAADMLLTLSRDFGKGYRDSPTRGLTKNTDIAPFSLREPLTPRELAEVVPAAISGHLISRET